MSTVRFLTEYSGLGGSSRMIVHLAGLLAERFGVEAEIHYREHGDPFLERYFRFRFQGIDGCSVHPHPSTEAAVDALEEYPDGGPLVGHLPFTRGGETLERLRGASGKLVLYNLEIPSRHAAAESVPGGVTVVCLSPRQAEGIEGDCVLIAAPFEEIERREEDARYSGRTVGMASAWARVKGIFESFDGFRRSHARRLRFWTGTNLRRKARWWLRDRRVRIHDPVIDLSEMYSRFDCLLHMQPHSMGESNVVRDCLSVGTPCVLSDIEGHRAYAGHPGVTLVDREDPGAIGEAIDRTLETEPETRPRLREAYRPHLPDNREIVGKWGELLGL